MFGIEKGLHLKALSRSQSVLLAAASWGHVGAHSGFVPLYREIEVKSPGLVQRIDIKRRRRFVSRLETGMRLLLGLPRPVPVWATIKAESPLYSENSWFIEREISEVVLKLKPVAVLLESVEDQLFLLAKEREKWRETRLIGVCHQPPAWWQLNHASPDIIKSLDYMIVLSCSARAYWEQFTDRERILVIPHGVDADFFTPTERKDKLSSQDGILRAVFSGQWLRDFETIAAVVAIVDDLNLPVRFEMIVPRFARASDTCYRMAMSPRVRWHSGLTDESLRSVYRQSDLLLLTLRDCTANNGLLEGMSCGLPVIITDVGGVRDYAKETFADFVRSRDALGIIDIIKGYLSQRDELNDRGAAARAHVENYLSWPKITSEYIRLFRSLS
jgi:glycosyltransferase involved in cell wall biosynthesis